MLIQVVEYNLGHSIAFEHDHEALAGTAGGLITQIGNSGDFTFLDEIGNLNRQVIGVCLVRQLGHHKASAPMDLFDIDDRAHRNGTAAGAVSILNTLGAQNGGTGGEVRSLNTFHKSTQKLFIRSIRVLEEPFHTCGNFTQVMWGNIGCHTHGDTRRPVDQQVRDARRQYRGLKRFTVIVRLKINGIFVDVTHHFQGNRRHLRLGIARGRSAVVTGRTEVALTKCQGITHRPPLNQAYQRIVDSTVAVRVELAHHIANDAGTFIESTVGAVTAVVHSIDHATMYRFKTVAYIR